MTEKRFVGLFQGDMLVSVKDTKTNNRVNIIQIIAIANKLSDENEQLKKEYREMEIKIGKLKGEIGELFCENEQLKSEIKDLNDVLARYEEKELME